VAAVGETIENPLSGERVTWIATAASSGGELLAFDLVIRRGAAVAMAHRHKRQVEQFSVRAGLIGVEMAGEERQAAPGEEVTIAAGVPHRWWNAGEAEATVRVELRPALGTEAFFETFFGLARDGRCTARGMPGLLQTALLLHELGDSAPRAPRMPLALQDLLAAGLAPVARRTGLRAIYPQYGSRRA
jgi:mannose-6-phosphate isomerase-like protein (cupin superfamily)